MQLTNGARCLLIGISKSLSLYFNSITIIIVPVPLIILLQQHNIYNNNNNNIYY